MKKIDESAISGTVGMPIKSGVLQHLQDATQDAALLSYIAALGLGIGYSNPSNTTPTILKGVYDGSGGGTFSCSDGILMYQGELFYLPATTFAITATPVVCLDIQYNNLAANADPVLFTDGNSRKVLQTRQLSVVDGSSSTSGYICDFSSLIVLPYEQNTDYVYDSTTTVITAATTTTIAQYTSRTGNNKSLISFTANILNGSTAQQIIFYIHRNGSSIGTINTISELFDANGLRIISFTIPTLILRNDIIEIKAFAATTSFTIDGVTLQIIQNRSF